MKVAIVIFLALILSGCPSMAGRIVTEYYNSVQLGPRAKINFTSPYLEPPMMSVYRISMVVYGLTLSDGNCSFRVQGKIPLSEGKNDKPVYVPANQRNYFAVIYKINQHYGSVSVVSSLNIRLFSFVPEDGREYTIEHIDNPGAMRIKYYIHDKANNKIPIEVNDIGDGFYVDSEHLCRFNKNNLLTDK